ncbi:PilN domain-containing protein [Mangrovitalea sediminis]|uniref:PilN domain-containing protein n=1 Tax=Mangrovitalea sediminis TaxID=1982043 RepID=UPI000BE4CCBD|nr:PilN domain-containing protein [Mangrovitalea sediminis]
MRQEVNLYTAELRPRKEPLVFRQLAWSATALVAMFVIAGFWLWHRHHALLAEQAALQASVSALQADDDRLAKAVGEMHIDPVLSQSVVALKNDIDQRLRLLSQIHTLSGAGQMGFSPYLTALARQSASDLWLREVVLNGSTGDVTLSGRTTKPEAVPDYLERLRQEAAFKGKSFAEFDMQRDDKKPILDFVLSTQGKDAVGGKP